MQLQSFNTVNFTAPFDAGGDAPQNTYRLVGRVDFNPSDRTQMFFRAGRENQNQFKGSYFYSAYPQYDGGSTNLNQSYLYSLSHTFTSNLFGSAKFSFTRFNDGQTFQYIPCQYAKSDANSTQRPGDSEFYSIFWSGKHRRRLGQRTICGTAECVSSRAQSGVEQG
jgi:hypothetical protein